MAVKKRSTPVPPFSAIEKALDDDQYIQHDKDVKSWVPLINEELEKKLFQGRPGEEAMVTIPLAGASQSVIVELVLLYRKDWTVEYGEGAKPGEPPFIKIGVSYF